jgi:UDP-N-acetylmuramoyl-tripeptide--D-alanyl-D-alanine ligase
MTIETLYEIYRKHPDIVTDSRQIKAGCIFFALKGERFNGNQFAEQALKKGAAYCVVDEDPGFINDRIIKVEDSLTALQSLAHHHRQQFAIPFIAITGSNGKTTTKELIHAVLSKKYITYTTVGNLNNHIGIPLTLLKVKEDAQMAIVEMGANHQREIAGYCTYTLPTHGLITNCGKAHLEGFGGVEGVRKGKGELYDFIRAKDGMIFMCADYDYLRDMSKGIGKIVTYGTSSADYIGRPTTENGFLSVQLTSGMQNPCIIHTQLVGEYNVSNVLAAVSIGNFFGVEEDRIKSAIENYEPTNSRSQMIQRESNRIIMDAYNANPSSMRAAIENFMKMDGDNKVVLIGGMKELGEESAEEHRKIVDLLKEYAWKHVVLVGEEFKAHHDVYLYFDRSEDAGHWFGNQGFENSLILIKGSRGTMMEKVLEV